MATHSSVLAWRIPGTGEPGGLPSVGSHRVGHNWSNLAVSAARLLMWSKWTPQHPCHHSSAHGGESSSALIHTLLPACKLTINHLF